MTQAQENRGALTGALKQQAHQIETLKGTLDSCIKARESKSILNQWALSYGESKWWKKTGIFMLVLCLVGAIIHFSGISLLWIFPFVGAYLIGAYFLSNHYQAHQTINTKTLETLESVLTESVDSLDGLSHELSLMTGACATLYQHQKKEEAALQHQIEQLTHANSNYKHGMTLLTPVAHELSEAEAAASEKSKALLLLLDETHQALIKEKDLIVEMLAPKLHATVDGLVHSTQHLTQLKTQFQKNMIYMNTFVRELDNVLHELEVGESRLEKEHTSSHEVSQGLLSGADEAIDMAAHFLSKSPASLKDENAHVTSFSPTFFRQASNTGCLKAAESALLRSN
ncbi:MAG: hypothetical protein P1U32_04875 [Legionellaceae bacterium]|nr:hypothetical protein [Legionellaceae bacterium]